MYCTVQVSKTAASVTCRTWQPLGSGKPTLPASTLQSEHLVLPCSNKSIEEHWICVDFGVTGFSGRETETLQPSGATLSLASHCQMMMTLVFWATSCRHPGSIDYKTFGGHHKTMPLLQTLSRFLNLHAKSDSTEPLKSLCRKLVFCWQDSARAKQGT